MAKVQLYTIPFCGFCIRAKRLLDERGVPYEDVDVSNDPDLRAKMSEKFSWDTVPMIVLDGKFIGGCSELVAIDEDKGLDHLK